ncbi:MAG: phosphate uptake regulator PhoU, partial [Deltaproteobacteria bacterium]|nr:phosphate uptake regulator PhoU [Deltaproteobacteria bacterium]
MLSSVTQNLRFMVHEVSAQVEQTLQFFAEPNRTLVDRINSRDDYIDTLKSLIQDRTYALLQSGGRLEKRQVNLLRAVNTIAVNLERIADFAVNMLRQSGHLTDPGFINYFEYESYFEEVLAGLERVQPALETRDVTQAYRICQSEFKLDQLYGGHFNRILADLRAGGETGNLITCLMILHYLERMGDSLLNIGEAVIYAILGESVKIHQYQALTDSLTASGINPPTGKIEFES